MLSLPQRLLIVSLVTWFVQSAGFVFAEPPSTRPFTALRMAKFLGQTKPFKVCILPMPELVGRSGKMERSWPLMTAARLGRPRRARRTSISMVCILPTPTRAGQLEIMERSWPRATAG